MATGAADGQSRLPTEALSDLRQRQRDEKQNVINANKCAAVDVQIAQSQSNNQDEMLQKSFFQYETAIERQTKEVHHSHSIAPFELELLNPQCSGGLGCRNSANSITFQQSHLQNNRASDQ